MDQNPPVKPPGTSSPPRESENWPPRPRERHPSTPKQPRVPETGTEQNVGDAAGSGEMDNSQQEGRELKKRIDGDKPEERGASLDKGKSEVGGEAKDERIKELEREIGKLRDSVEIQARRIRETEEKLKRIEGLLATRPAELSRTQTSLSTKDSPSEAGDKAKDERIEELEREIWKLRDSAESQAKRVRETEEKLEHTEELLATRPAELPGAQTFLSTKDRLPEAEVLDIVRDLNQNIYQVAVRLTEEWEKLEPPQATNQRNADSTSRHSRMPVPTLVQQVRNQDYGSLTFLLQSRLCYQAAYITSRWSRHQDLTTLNAVYERLFASEGQAISARWRSLTHTYLLRRPPIPEFLAEELAKELHGTKSFKSPRHSVEFVQNVALDGIKSIIQLALRLDSVFKMDITSSDMSLLFETRGTLFDDARMTSEYGSDGVPTPGKQDEKSWQYRIAGTTEVGVGKRICEGKNRRTVILLKTNVVLNTDVAGSGK